MKLKIPFVFLVAFTLLYSCKKTDNTLESYLSQSWQTTYLKIEMNTHKNSDSLYVFEDKFEGNPDIIAQSKYKKDGTFSAWYLTKNGEKQSETDGKWFVKGDSLTISYTFDNKLTKVSYFVTRIENGFRAESKSDWDNDGKMDDILIMKTKKLTSYEF